MELELELELVLMREICFPVCPLGKVWQDRGMGRVTLGRLKVELQFEFSCVWMGLFMRVGYGYVAP